MAKGVDTSKLVQRAQEAADKSNFEYAFKLYFDAIALNPDDARTRIGLRTTAKLRFDKAGGKIGFAAAVGWGANILAAWIWTLLKKRDNAAMSYEKSLIRNPVNPFSLWSLGQSLKASGRQDAQIVTLEFLRQNNPGHINALRELARIYVQRGDIQRAGQRYQAILQVLPHDMEAFKQVHNLAATESMANGWDKGDNFQDKMRDKDKASRLEQSQRIVRTADDAAMSVERVAAELKAAPDRPPLWAEMGDLEKKRDNLDAAEAAYAKAIELDPGNQVYMQKLMDVKLARFDANIKAARAAAETGDRDAAARAEALEAGKNDFWLAELKRRVDERPTDMGLRYNLGMLYFNTGRITEAIGEFQRIIRDAKYRLVATSMLGKSFARRDLDDLAIEQLEKALAEMNIADDAGKDVAYELGCLYEKTGNYAAAEDMYKKIFSSDINYLDISDRMQRVYKKRREKNISSNPEGNP